MAYSSGRDSSAKYFTAQVLSQEFPEWLKALGFRRVRKTAVKSDH